MKRSLFLAALAAFGLIMPVEAKDGSQPKPGVTCSPKDTLEEEAEKYVEYYVNGKQHIEYCVNGKKQVIIDHGQNG